LEPFNFQLRMAHRPNADGTRSVSLQVKTQRGNGHKWPLGKKHESVSRDNLFYVFVTLKKPGELPDYYVVPSKTVARRIRENHEEWLAKTDRHGRKHKDNPMRLFVDYAKYQDRWDLLGL